MARYSRGLCHLREQPPQLGAEHTRDRSVLVGKLAEILKDQRPTRKVAAMFIDMAFGSPIYERLRALGFNNVFETNFGLVHRPDRTKANMRAFMWDKMNGMISIAGDTLHSRVSVSRVLEHAADALSTTKCALADKQPLMHRSAAGSKPLGAP